MKGWQETELENVAPYIKEKVGAVALDATNYISADNMMPNVGGITLSDYVPTSGKATAYQHNDVLVSNIRPYFKKIWRARKAGGCSNDVLVFRSIPQKAHPVFLYYQLSQNDFFDFMMAGSNGVKMPRGNRNLIPKYKFQLPPLPIQQKIAGILSAYDDLIENNLKRIKLLEEMAQITYEEWFVCLRFPGHESVSINPETGLPEGWVKIKCYDAMEVLSGGTPRTSVEEYWGGKIPFYTPKDAVDCSYIFETEKYVTELGVSKCNSKLYPLDTVFITARGTVGKVNLAGRPMAMNQSCYALKGKPGVPQYFLYCSIKAAIDAFKGVSTGGVFNTIVVDTFRFLPFIMPSKELLVEFNDKVTPMFLEIANLIKQNQRLREARDILLPRLMTGMIDVEQYDPADLLKAVA